MVVLYILIALIILMILITVHEFGHYVAGKALGFRINEFSIGFGKALFSKKKKNGEVFSIRLVPLGGYCAFDGEDEAETSETGFNSQKPWKRLIVQVAGAFFNILFGIIMCAVLLMSVGYDIQQVAEIANTNPYGNALQVGDVIKKVDGKKVSIVGGNFLNNIISEHKDGDKVTLTVIRDGEKIEVEQFVYDSGEGAKLGVQTQAYKHTFFEGIGRSFEVSFGICETVLEGLWGLITGKYGIKEVSGPVGTIGVMANLASQSLRYILLLIPLISINLGVFNLLPIPALDGGRVVFTLYEMIFRKPVRREVEAKIHFVGLIVLFSLVILIDVINIFI